MRTRVEDNTFQRQAEAFRGHGTQSADTVEESDDHGIRAIRRWKGLLVLEAGDVGDGDTDRNRSTLPELLHVLTCNNLECRCLLVDITCLSAEDHERLLVSVSRPSGCDLNMFEV